MMKNIITNIFAKLALVAGLAITLEGSTFAQEQTWSHTFASPEAISNNSITVNGATWSVATTAGAGTPSISNGNTYSKYGLKFGQNRYNYYGSVSFSTDYYNSYNVKSVTVRILNNGYKAGSLTAQQGTTSIGSSSQTFGTTWTDLTVNTNTGSGGTLSFTYSVQQAFYINMITVVYTTGSSSATYTVTYDANGGTGTMTDSNSPYATGATVTVLSNTFSRDGYSFSKWNTANDGNGQDYYAGSTFTISANTTLYAQWTSNAAATTTEIDDSGITNTDVYTSTAAGSLSASVTAGGNSVQEATVTWSGNNDAVATINENGVVTLVAAGTVTFTALYAGLTGTYQASSAEYQMTVTSSAPYVQPTEIQITPNYTFWGKSAQFSGDTYSDLSGSKDNVTLDWSRGNGSTYANQNAMRFYKDNELTFTAPTGYEIKSIELTVSGTYDDLGFSPEGWDGTKTVWSGSSKTVTMSRPSNATSYATISSFTITIGAPSTVTTPTISPADGTTFGNDGLDVTISAANGTIYYTLDGTAPTSSSSAYSEAIHITTTTTVKAIAVDGSDVSNIASATYTYVDPNAPGTQNNPYTVAQAIANTPSSGNVYIHGIVSAVRLR